MRLAAVPAAGAAVALGTHVALADDASGTVKSLGSDGRSFTLSDGNVYKLEESAPKSAMELIRSMKPGQKVRVTYNMQSAAHWVTDVHAAE